MDHDHHHHHHPGRDEDDAALAELLDLDAEVLHSYLSEVTGRVHDLAAVPSAASSTWAAGPGTARSPWPGASPVPT